MNHNINTDEIKRFIAGREFEIAKQLEILIDGGGKEHKQYCPFCKGESGERFYIRTGEKTSFHCRQKCFNGDLFALVMKSYSVDFNEAKRLIANAAGYVGGATHISQPANEIKKAVSEGKPLPPPTLDTFRLDADSPVYKATAAHRPDITFDDYRRVGAKLFTHGICVPMFDNSGVLSGWVRYFTDGGKKNSFGSKSGIVGTDAIYNLRTAKQVKVVFKTAGVSDYLVLSGMIARLGLDPDYYAFTNGAGENENPDKFDALLRPALEGKTVGIIQDNDVPKDGERFTPGELGAQKWATAIAEYAANVRIIKLPPVVFDCEVKDLRDFFATDGTGFTDLLFT